MKLQIFICQLFLTICFTSEPGSPVELPVNSCENLNVDKLNCFNVIVPGSRDRRVGSNKKLELSRNWRIGGTAMNFRGQPQTKGKTLIAALKAERAQQSSGAIFIFFTGFLTGACVILWLLLC